MKKVVRIKDLFDKASSTLKQRDAEGKEGKYPVYAASGVIGYLNTFEQSKECIALVKDGSIGKVYLLPPKSSVIATIQYLLPKNGFNTSYLAYCLQSIDFSKYKQGAAIPHIYFKDYGQHLVTIDDSPEEQDLIVQRINLSFQNIDKLKGQAEKALQEAKQMFLAVLDEVMTPSSDWDNALLGKICVSLTDGDHLPPPKSDQGIPFITIGNIDKRLESISFEKTFFVPESYYLGLKEKRIPHKGEILYTVTGSFGIPILIKTDINFCFQRHIALIKPKTDIVRSDFLYYWLKTSCMQKQADKVATGAAQRTVSLKSLREFQVRYPKNTKEQDQIISRLDKLSSKVLELQLNYDKISSECDILKSAILKDTFK